MDGGLKCYGNPQLKKIQEHRFRRIVTGGVGDRFGGVVAFITSYSYACTWAWHDPVHAVATSLIVNIYFEPMVDNADCAYIDRAMSP
jgi:hypothetical protein